MSFLLCKSGRVNRKVLRIILNSILKRIMSSELRFISGVYFRGEKSVLHYPYCVSTARRVTKLPKVVSAKHIAGTQILIKMTSPIFSLPNQA